MRWCDQSVTVVISLSDAEVIRVHASHQRDHLGQTIFIDRRDLAGQVSDLVTGFLADDGDDGVVALCHGADGVKVPEDGSVAEEQKDLKSAMPEAKSPSRPPPTIAKACLFC
jgi:hypothetical protein